MKLVDFFVWISLLLLWLVAEVIFDEAYITGIRPARWLFICIWINGVELSSVDELVALDDDDEHDTDGRLWINKTGVDGERESFSIWLRLKSEKCLSIVDFNAIIAVGNEGSARTIFLNRWSFGFLNGSGDDDVFVTKGFLNADWEWYGNERRVYGVRRIYGDEIILLLSMRYFDDKFVLSS